MELKLLFLLYLTTLPLSIWCIAIEKNEERQNTTVKDTEEYNEDDALYEEKPNPSPLIIPGYNLPGPIFNNGKPFYVEKDPVTGAIDFNSKTPAGKQTYLEYEYIDEEPSTNIFDKSNIDRKDGNFGSHRPNDINQLTPNFHDFLNLPVKYNPDKYVYPLISSSYANTKIQGNVQNSYNHKTYNTNIKPTVSPTYYTTKSVYYQPKETTTEKVTTTTKTTTTTTTTTTSPTTKNLLNSPMNHPSYTTEEPEYDNDYDYFTTKAPEKIPPKDKTTQRPYSIFDELFGDYEEPKPAIKPPSLFSNLPSLAFGDKVKKEEVEKKNDTKPGLTNLITQNSHGIPVGNKEEYEYDYDESAENTNKSQIVTPESTKSTTEKITTTKKIETVYSNFHQNYKPEEVENSYTVYPQNDTKPTEKTDFISITSENYDDYEEESKSTTKIVSITETPPAMRVTSLPLGENHPAGVRLPIISLTNGNLKEQLMNEMVEMTTKTPEKEVKPLSSSNIHIAPDQDMVSFVVGNQQKVDNKKETFVSNSFRPLYTQNQAQQQPVLDQNGKVKETITFTGTGQTNSNYSWTVPQKYDNYPNFDTMPANVYNQEIQSNYSWTIPEATPPKYEQPIKYNPSQTNSLYNSAPEYNLQQVSSGYSVGQGGSGYNVGQGGSGYAQGSVYNVGPNYGNKYKVPQGNNYQFAQVGTNYNLTVYPEGGASANIQPLRGTEASLSIGSPTNEIKTIPGQVVDEQLDLDSEITKNKPSNKIVFPDDKPTTYAPNPNREILSLYSKPMLHQLPSDLTPPSEKEVKQPVRNPNVRPPWDPRPGHFYSGRPEYARPPRPPHKPEVYKRIDGLPNILPQFRPNAKVGSGNHYHDIPINSGYMQRQPLLERPSNRPIGFFEKLHPPPPPKRILELRKPVTLNQHLMQSELKERHQHKEKTEHKTENYKNEPQFNGFPPQIPPKVPVANRRNGEDETEIATLQMLHAKQSDKVNTIKPNMPPPFKINYKETTDKPLYVVYPVNSSPLKLDVLDTENKETVVIGTRSEPPLPPSKIGQEFPTFTEPILKPKDSPILKPHPKPTFPVKTDFPYPIEKPDPTSLYTPETTSKDLDEIKYDPYQANNQWTTLETESRIINGNKINYVAEPISATLKTYTQSPIAIAYTPTESTDEKYSLPNYASSVISEIRNSDKSHQHGIVGNQGSEFTVSAVMHTHHQNNMMLGNTVRKGSVTSEKLENHKIEETEPQYPPKLDFQAPFQASVNIGSTNNGWSVVRDRSKENIDRKDDDGGTTLLPESSSEFDIENFKPQMFGGFKPIYDFPEEKVTEEKE